MKSKILILGLVCLFLISSISYDYQDQGKYDDLLGTWKCYYKIISWWTTYITVTKVTNKGKIVAKDSYGNSMWGWTRNDVAFICYEKADYIWEGFYFTYKGKRFAKYLSIIEFLYDFDSGWGKMRVNRTSYSQIETDQFSRQNMESTKLWEIQMLKNQIK